MENNTFWLIPLLAPSFGKYRPGKTIFLWFYNYNILGGIAAFYTYRKIHHDRYSLISWVGQRNIRIISSGGQGVKENNEVLGQGVDAAKDILELGVKRAGQGDKENTEILWKGCFVTRSCSEVQGYIRARK